MASQDLDGDGNSLEMRSQLRSEVGWKHRSQNLALPILFLILSLSPAWVAWGQDWEQAGLGKLRALLGDQLETGQGVSASLVEADIDGGTGRSFLPDPGNAQFQGKTLINGSGAPEGISSHATQVGSVFFGKTASATPGIGTATTFDRATTTPSILFRILLRSRIIRMSGAAYRRQWLRSFWRGMTTWCGAIGRRRW
jgi:hypothetical protein